jgi:gamma-glutamylcyclotransferase
MRILYFAYGSNMATSHMVSRIPSAEPLGRARLRDKRVVFNKRSKDGSGKANLIDSPGSVSWGVLYKVDFEDMKTLDRIEGGYVRTQVTVQLDEGSTVLAETYTSAEVTDEPVAYGWYRDLLVTGAREHSLPTDYVCYLESLPAKADTSTSKAC